MEILDAHGPQMVLNGPQAVATLCRELLDSPQEVFYWIGVDVRLRVVAVQEMFRGTVDACIVHPRDVYRSALATAPILHGLIVIHNHPSGCCDPSQEDLDCFKRLEEAGQLLQIPLLDALVIAQDGIWSRAQGGAFPLPPASRPASGRPSRPGPAGKRRRMAGKAAVGVP
jgi:DNA repair protein RadC